MLREATGRVPATVLLGQKVKRQRRSVESDETDMQVNRALLKWSRQEGFGARIEDSSLDALLRLLRKFDLNCIGSVKALRRLEGFWKEEEANELAKNLETTAGRPTVFSFKSQITPDSSGPDPLSLHQPYVMLSEALQFGLLCVAPGDVLFPAEDVCRKRGDISDDPLLSHDPIIPHIVDGLLFSCFDFQNHEFMANGFAIMKGALYADELLVLNMKMHVLATSVQWLSVVGDQPYLPINFTATKRGLKSGQGGRFMIDEAQLYSIQQCMLVLSGEGDYYLKMKIGRDGDVRPVIVRFVVKGDMPARMLAMSLMSPACSAPLVAHRESTKRIHTVTAENVRELLAESVANGDTFTVDSLDDLEDLTVAQVRDRKARKAAGGASASASPDRTAADQPNFFLNRRDLRDAALIRKTDDHRTSIVAERSFDIQSGDLRFAPREKSEYSSIDLLGIQLPAICQMRYRDFAGVLGWVSVTDYAHTMYHGEGVHVLDHAFLTLTDSMLYKAVNPQVHQAGADLALFGMKRTAHLAADKLNDASARDPFKHIRQQTFEDTSHMWAVIENSLFGILPEEARQALGVFFEIAHLLTSRVVTPQLLEALVALLERYIKSRFGLMALAKLRKFVSTKVDKTAAARNGAYVAKEKKKEEAERKKAEKDDEKAQAKQDREYFSAAKAVSISEGTARHLKSAKNLTRTTQAQADKIELEIQQRAAQSRKRKQKRDANAEAKRSRPDAASAEDAERTARHDLEVIRLSKQLLALVEGAMDLEGAPTSTGPDVNVANPTWLAVFYLIIHLALHGPTRFGNCLKAEEHLRAIRKSMLDANNNGRVLATRAMIHYWSWRSNALLRGVDLSQAHLDASGDIGGASDGNSDRDGDKFSGGDNDVRGSVVDNEDLRRRLGLDEVAGEDCDGPWFDLRFRDDVFEKVRGTGDDLNTREGYQPDSWTLSDQAALQELVSGLVREKNVACQKPVFCNRLADTAGNFIRLPLLNQNSDVSSKEDAYTSRCRRDGLAVLRLFRARDHVGDPAVTVLASEFVVVRSTVAGSAWEVTCVWGTKLELHDPEKGLYHTAARRAGGDTNTLSRELFLVSFVRQGREERTIQHHDVWKHLVPMMRTFPEISDGDYERLIKSKHPRRGVIEDLSRPELTSFVVAHRWVQRQPDRCPGMQAVPSPVLREVQQRLRESRRD
jgi:hypothetical protein